MGDEGGNAGRARGLDGKTLWMLSKGAISIQTRFEATGLEEMAPEESGTTGWKKSQDGTSGAPGYRAQRDRRSQ